MATAKPPAIFRTRHPLWLLLVFSCGVILALNLLRMNVINQTFIPLPKRHIELTANDDTNQRGFLVKTSGCRIPDMQPMDASIKKYIFSENPVVCNNGLPPLIDANLTAIFIIESSLSEYNVTHLSRLNCCYKVFRRIVPKKNERDKLIKYDNCVRFVISAVITDEFVNVQCKYDEIEIYQDYFSFLVPPNLHNSSSINKLSVLIIGLDAISRLNFHRQMPKTVKFLKQYDTVEMLGYNKVADNTFPNMIPVLTGYHEDELKDDCWHDINDHFDNCTFMWDRYKKNGYVTAFGEDSAWMGIFNYQKKGFAKQPTDYFWGQFNWEAESKIGDSHLLNVYQCMGSRLVHRVLLDYIEKFCTVLAAASAPYFALFWQSSLSHDILNKPRLGDDDYYWLFKNLQDAGYLNSTILVVMSDHGIRWGDIRGTFQGRMEERLPFLYIGLPEWLRTRMPHLQNNLKTNTRRLTTPFDLFETLLDLLSGPNELTTDYLLQRNVNVAQRGYSLFAPIRESRNCHEAGIPTHYCTCQSSVAVNTNTSAVINAANHTIAHINNMLDGYGECAILEIDDIIDARMRTHDDSVMKERSISDYVITVRTRPGDALFEATVRRTEGAQGAEQFDVTDTVSRINMYGEQSVCITDYHLKLYCFCK